MEVVGWFKKKLQPKADSPREFGKKVRKQLSKMKEKQQNERVNSDEDYKDCFDGGGDTLTSSSTTTTTTVAGAGGGMMMLEQLGLMLQMVRQELVEVLLQEHE